MPGVKSSWTCLWVPKISKTIRKLQVTKSCRQLSEMCQLKMANSSGQNLTRFPFQDFLQDFLHVVNKKTTTTHGGVSESCS